MIKMTCPVAQTASPSPLEMKNALYIKQQVTFRPSAHYHMFWVWRMEIEAKGALSGVGLLIVTFLGRRPKFYFF